MPAACGPSPDPATGGLTYRDCITGSQASGPSGSGACKQIRGATDFGPYSGLGYDSLTLSKDGAFLYGLSSNEVTRFARDPLTGRLTYKGCIPGDTFSGPSGSGACSE